MLSSSTVCWNNNVEWGRGAGRWGLTANVTDHVNILQVKALIWAFVNQTLEMFQCRRKPLRVREGVEHIIMGSSERIDTILNWTELS